MTDVQLEQAIENARAVASRVGSMHALWDVIFDAELLLAGKPSIMSRQQVEEHLSRVL